MTYRWVDHTADLELEIESPSEPAVFEEALRALAELLAESDGHSDATSTTRREVTAEAPDRPTLLAAWIEELAFLAESEGFVATRIVEINLAGGGLRATVAGALGDPPPLVKAVTYHRLTFEPYRDGYVARVVLDV
ncbi:MAG: archease [Solirubrobacterales bacterium]|nr:archease [Solirubrobacterales bacterium]